MGMCRSTGYGFCFPESGTGSTNQHFCLEQGVLFAHLDFVFCQDRAANEHCSCSGPTTALLKHAIAIIASSQEQGIHLHHFVGNRIENVCLLVWNRVLGQIQDLAKEGSNS